MEFPMKSCYFDVNSNEKFLGKLCNKNIHEKLHIQENYTLKITHAAENYTCMQEVKISLQIGEITHEIGEKNNTGRKQRGRGGQEKEGKTPRAAEGGRKK